MAGLISDVINTEPKLRDINGATAGLTTATGYTPSQVTIDPAKQSVSGQLKAILSEGSPYLDRARASALETANSRGLINSTMAAQAGEAAAIDAALPIASADANIYNNAEFTNKAAENQASQFGAGASNTASLANAGAVSDIGKLQEQGSQQRQTLAQSGQQEQQLQTMKGEQAQNLANIEATYKGLIQASSSASDLFKNLSGSMNVLLADPNTTAEQKQAGVNAMSQVLKAGLAVVGSISNLDLGGLLDFSVA